MIIRLAGVRGSLPSPGPSTVKYGGNTTSVMVDLGSEGVLILDAGSGIRQLGLDLLEDSRSILLMLTHVHWDHIQGVPFFKPIYRTDRPVRILLHCDEWIGKLKATMDGNHYFPMKFDDLPCDIEFVTQKIESVLWNAGVKLSRIRANHPGLCYGFRLEHHGRSVVFLPDNELSAPKTHSTFAEFVAFCQGADLLIHDSQYTAGELPHKRGWGHSTAEEVTRLASEARVREVVLFHHDPGRDDDAVESIEASARKRLEGSGILCGAAREGSVFDLE